MQPRPPERKGTRAGTGDAESEGDHATSTGAVADGGRAGMGRARKSAREQVTPEIDVHASSASRELQPLQNRVR